MAKPNYSYEKRQRELAKKKKKEEKRAQKAALAEAAKTDTDVTTIEDPQPDTAS